MNTRLTVSIVLLVVVVVIAVAVLGAVGRTSAPIAPGAASSSGPDMMGVGQQFITQADNGKIVTMKVGSRFALKLGEEQWNIAISDPTVIRRLPNFAMVRGAQGMYQVMKAGTTTLSAEGRPVCNPGEMCAQYIVNFSTTIHAQ